MKDLDLKQNLLEDNVILIENEIMDTNLEDINNVISDNKNEFALIILNNITGGSYKVAQEMGKTLNQSECNVSFICNGNINISGIIPLVAGQFKDRTATKNTRFILDIKDYMVNYIEEDEHEDFNAFLKNLLTKESLYFPLETFVFSRSRIMLDVNQAYVNGIVDDIEYFDQFNRITDVNFIQRKKVEQKLIMKRRERDNLKYNANNKGIYININ